MDSTIKIENKKRWVKAAISTTIPEGLESRGGENSRTGLMPSEHTGVRLPAAIAAAAHRVLPEGDMDGY